MNSVDQLSLIPAVQDATIDSESVSLSHKALRKLILDIQKDESLTQEEKARKVQNLMCKSWLKHRNQGQEDLNFDTKISSADIAPSYYDYELGLLGCKHYQRAVKIQAHCCGKWFTCRFCHDEVSDHTITRTLTKTMICMHCKHVQPASQHCENESCGKKVAKYYCDTCKLWDNEETKHIYHCNGCGICRIGKGLDIDYFHCDKCNVCMAITLKDNHKCIERNLESDCPICGEFMFTSTTTVMFMPCGHSIHYKCHQEYIQTSYQCPTCSKSLANMSDYFRRIDTMLASNTMPDEYKNTLSHIYCNDCEKKSYTPYHFLYHKCQHCNGYNSKLLSTMSSQQSDLDSNSSSSDSAALNPNSV